MMTGGPEPAPRPGPGLGLGLETGPGSDPGPEAGPGPGLDPRPAPARFVWARNVLIGVGAFYASRWMAALLRTALTALAEGLMSADGLRQALLTPFVTSLSHALAAASAGAVVVLLADAAGSRGTQEISRSVSLPATSARWRWAIVPAVLWFVASLDEVTISAPGWVHLVTQLIAAALPSIVCLAAGHLADWHRSR
jgi:hypothetical protein